MDPDLERALHGLDKATETSLCAPPMLEIPRNATGISPATVVAVTTMLRLNPRQRAVLANKVPDMANIVAGAIVLGFAIGEPRVTWPVLAGGIAFWAGALLFAVMIAEEKS
jgi:hypothetical protein